MYVSGVESKLPNGVILSAEYTELKDSGVTTGFGVFTDALRHIPFCLILQRHCSSILFYSAVIHLLFYYFHPHLYCTPSMNLGVPAEKNPYRPGSASGKSVGLAHCHIGLMTFYFQPAPPHLGSECLTLGLPYSPLYTLYSGYP